MHKLWFLVLALLLMGASCGHNAVVRDTAVYKTELNFLEQAALQNAEALKGFINNHCTCTDGDFTDEKCLAAAKKVLVVEARVPWHKAMMLYNARLLEERPPKDPPEVPETGTLCPAGGE